MYSYQAACIHGLVFLFFFILDTPLFTCVAELAVVSCFFFFGVW